MPETPIKVALFNPFNGQLEQLFSYIDIGDLGLPDIQRPFVWNDSKVRDLFDSIYRGYPIGSYLFWRNSVGGKSKQIGLKQKEHSDPSILIIDGQQRLTALYSVFRGVAVKDSDYEDRIIEIAFNPFTEEFKVADASTERNPEFINNITQLFTKTTTRNFINSYLDRIKKDKDNLYKKYKAIINKISDGIDLTQSELDLLIDKIKSQSSDDDKIKIILEKIGFVEEEKIEIDNENGIDENESDIIEDSPEEFGNAEIAMLKKEEKEIINNVLLKNEQIDEDSLSSRIEKVYNLKNYPFNALEIVPDLSEEMVAAIFTRINSKGTVLRQADFILTLLSVFWRNGRSEIDEFCKNSRKLPKKEIKESPYNYIFEPSPKDLIRIIVGLGFNRGKMKDAYAILTGRDFLTKKYSEQLRNEQFDKYKDAQKTSLDNTNWHGFLKILLGIGFKSSTIISSTNNIANAYILYLIAKTKYDFNHKELEKIIGRWFFFSSITSRYSYSPESQMESDLNLLKEAKEKKQFKNLLDITIDNEFTNDFWEITVPNKLLVSSSKNNAIRNTFFACLIKRNTNVLFSSRKISDLFDPSMKKRKKDLEKHHIFPNHYLAKKYSMNKKQIHQVANFTYLEFEDNIDISDTPPEEYYREIKEKYYNGKEQELFDLMKEHCIPEDFYTMDYDQFLKERRKLMANLVRKTFETL